MTFTDATFWVALLQIIGVNIVLSGDNAVVIALAARSLPPKQQKQAVLWGSGAAVIMRIVLTVVAVQLLTMKFMARWPIIITIGGALLGWVAGEMAIGDPAMKDWVDANAAWLHYGAPILGTAIVVAIGKWMASRSAEEEITRPIVDLASPADQHVPGAASAGTRTRVLLLADDSPSSLRGVDRFVEQARANGVMAVDLLKHRCIATSATSFTKAPSRDCITKKA
jgi:hypothetical protein